MIASGTVPVARLDVVFRQAEASGIVTAAHAMNAGVLPELGHREGSDFFFIEREDSKAALETVVELVSRRVPGKFGFDPVRDIQVLSAMRKGTLGVRSVNEALQAAINPGRPGDGEVERFGVTYRAGDKVIQTRNNYDKDVFNGDIGVVRAVDRTEREVTVDYEGRRVVYEFGEMDELDPAWAITVHKSQGSEFPCVIVPVAMEQFVLLQRNLIYTAITRGKALVIVVGQRKALAAAVRNDRLRERVSGLRGWMAS